MLDNLLKMGTIQESYKVISDEGEHLRTVKALIIDNAEIQDGAIELADKLDLHHFYEEDGFHVIELGE